MPTRRPSSRVPTKERDPFTRYKTPLSRDLDFHHATELRNNKISSIRKYGQSSSEWLRQFRRAQGGIPYSYRVKEMVLCQARLARFVQSKVLSLLTIDQIKASRKLKPSTSMTLTIRVNILLVFVPSLFDLSFQYSRAPCQTRSCGRPQLSGFYTVKIVLSMEGGGMISISLRLREKGLTRRS